MLAKPRLGHNPAADTEPEHSRVRSDQRALLYTLISNNLRKHLVSTAFLEMAVIRDETGRQRGGERGEGGLRGREGELGILPSRFTD